MLWHRRLGHISLDVLKQLLDLPATYHNSNIDSCFTCAQSKQTIFSFPHSSPTTKAYFDLIHVDVWGPHKLNLIMVISTSSLLLMTFQDTLGFIF